MKTFAKTLLALSITGLVACGGGGGGSTPVAKAPAPAPTPTYPAVGTVLSSECDSTTLVETIANGTGGSTTERTENSDDCVKTYTLYEASRIFRDGYGGASSQVYMDLDDDGDTDVVYFRTENLDPNNGDSGAPEATFILRNNGQDRYTITESNIRAYSHTAKVVDINNDGLDDVFMVADHLGGHYPAFMLFQTPGGDLVDVSDQIEEYKSDSWHGLTDLDYDNDGDVDFIGSVLNTGLVLFLNDGNGVFTVDNSVFPDLIDERVFYTAIHAVDLDKDTLPDLAIAGPSGVGFKVLRNTGSGFSYDPDKDNVLEIFSQLENPTNNETPLNMTSIDLDGDSCLDLVVQYSDYQRSQAAEVYSGNCAGGLVLSQTIILDTPYWFEGGHMYVKDMNNDGVDDILIGEYNEITNYMILLNNNGVLEIGETAEGR